MAVAVDLIKQFPLFQGLADIDLQTIAQNTQLGAAKQGQEILSRGAIVSYLTFIINGRIQASEIADDNRIIAVNLLGPGDVIGCLTLVDNLPSSVSLQTIEDSQLMLVPMSLARQLLKNEPLIAERILILMAQSLRYAIKERAMLSLPNAFHRIFVQLNMLVNNKSMHGHASHIPRQQDIATMANTSRETVSRALQLLIKNGVLTKSGRQLHIQQSDALKKLAAVGLDALTQEKHE
ncbi:Crp/Fnr family transcriptional regulator [Polynucleobacter asymbioticus]|jgi:CRP-like cAMP-binding protein|uniref:Crp/Fnr family transcriptional regulator n=1 Tax=Polynucleobacter asymbioticus TaxID=576611 RepID=A0AAC9IU22_9BURK|nr:Crp/Fnr family transcriptional regulator [Polynucleobacter asymbioticus]APB98164.1 hypothetical protein A4F89_01845 [Polynucleobacter asymbioticus]APC00450.1 hypothetical protein AOC25_01850 [Polynucleobacter asymbioticus]